MSEFTIFPKGFIFGAATASYQIEGAWNEDGKGPSIWDTFTHKKGKTAKNENGDVACDHYHRYKEDVKLMKELNLASYRFSISWPRVIPQGIGKVNDKGMDFYNSLIDELLKNNISPFITLYHWDLPQALQDKGGWGNRDSVNWFAEYCSVITKQLGDRVKYWITFNEPWVFNIIGSLIGYHAPGKYNPWYTFRSIHHVLLSHGNAIGVIKAQSSDANVGITLDLSPLYPYTDKEKDKWACNIADQANNRLFLDPLFKGKYPEELWKRISLFTPEIKENDMKIITTKMDFLGINNYTRDKIYYDWKVPFFKFSMVDQKKKVPEKEFVKNGIQYTSMGYEVYQDSLYELLLRIKNEYGNPVVYITENGAGFTDVVEDGRVHDQKRTDYLKALLNGVKKAIDQGSNCKGYFVWSLMDNFEWAEGYMKQLGIIYVDYPTQKRIIKDSGLWYSEFLKAQKGA